MHDKIFPHNETFFVGNSFGVFFNLVNSTLLIFCSFIQLIIQVSCDVDIRKLRCNYFTYHQRSTQMPYLRSSRLLGTNRTYRSLCVNFFLVTIENHQIDFSFLLTLLIDIELSRSSRRFSFLMVIVIKVWQLEVTQNFTFTTIHNCYPISVIY